MNPSRRFTTRFASSLVLAVHVEDEEAAGDVTGGFSGEDTRSLVVGRAAHDRGLKKRRFWWFRDSL